jgi:translation elongation factor EF-Tu-like GTPase
MTRKVLTVHIQLRPGGEGRLTPIHSGYRSLVRFEAASQEFGFELELDPTQHKNGLAPGDAASARVSLWAVRDLPIINVGDRFEIREGSRIIGHGTVTSA